VEYSLNNFYGRREVLGSTLHLTQMNARDVSLGIKATVCRAQILTIFMCQLYRKSGRLKLVEPSDSV